MFKIFRQKKKRKIVLEVSLPDDEEGIISGQNFLLALANLCVELDGDKIFDKSFYSSNEFKGRDDNFH